MKRLLLLSNSTNAGEPYLSYPREQISSFLGSITKVLFIPYAAITFSYDDYQQKVNQSLAEIGVQVTGIHHYKDPIKAIEEADAIMVGGGNTFKLVHDLHQQKLVSAIQQKVDAGTPYIGWSAGSNLACPRLCTTNDMPIIEPESFKSLNLIPFQINPHYLDANPTNFAGETRQQRIEEFLEVNRDVTVVGLREGTMFKVEANTIKLIGTDSCRLFNYGTEPKELWAKEDINFLLSKPKS